ncbi:GNAT family N-acetyltransferase [Flammeovirga aprica]|uniref:GNAT family N-acetyltransferase n=1 Tax=Flammeovirga aprica JL-4 TaxID=694437 RepID=A0A7X9RZI1_9BACT|nr:GNAT family N-acetyltransferase [Flammeovirga aprica]NME71569.1 GNAT family N-acetyltransferase [Flammeovirga aprica JL-4]
MQKIVINKPDEKLDHQIFDGLRKYSDQFTTSKWEDVEPLSIYIKDENDNLIAGLTAKSYWKVLHIDHLWVSSTQRGKHLGKQLMDIAEDEARKRECLGVVLDTMSFQAQPFYEKRGYEFIGKADIYPEGISKNYMQKKF